MRKFTTLFTDSEIILNCFETTLKSGVKNKENFDESLFEVYKNKMISKNQEIHTDLLSINKRFPECKITYLF